MGLVAEILGIHAVRQLCDPGHQLGRDLDVLPGHLVEGADPETGADLDEGEGLLGEGPDHAGDEAARGRPAVKLGEELGVQLARCARQEGRR